MYKLYIYKKNNPIIILSKKKIKMKEKILKMASRIEHISNKCCPERGKKRIKNIITPPLPFSQLIPELTFVFILNFLFFFNFFNI